MAGLPRRLVCDDVWVTPARGRLTDVMGAVAAHLQPGIAVDALGLPDAKRYVVVLLDGLGWANLMDDPALSPVLGGLGSSQLTVGLPSTTATSLTSFTTGADTVQHGIVGYSFRTRPGVIMHTMVWDDRRCRPEEVQPVPTWFQRLDVPSAVVMPEAFAGSGLTRAVLRGAEFVGVPDEKNWAARAAQVVAVLASHPLTYVYERSLDHLGHVRGWRSEAWRRQLARVDGFIKMLRDDLPSGTGLVVTADHGMVDVPAVHRVVIEAEPQLSADVDLIAGEARLRHLYTDQPEAVAKRWENWWGARAEVRTKAKALPWFGANPPGDAVASRLGDVVVATLDDWAMLTTTRPAEATMIGLHGSTSIEECVVPLLKGLI